MGCAPSLPLLAEIFPKVGEWEDEGVVKEEEKIAKGKQDLKHLGDQSRKEGRRVKMLAAKLPAGNIV